MKTWLRASIIVLAVVTATGAQMLPMIAPEQAGLSKPRLDRIRPAIEKEIAQNRLAGGIGLIARRGNIAYFET